MNGKLRTAGMILLAAVTVSQFALAETVSFNGTVGVKNTVTVYAPIGGTIKSVDIPVGQSVGTGEAIAQLETTKVYATEAGKVTGIFGQPGDSAETVAQHYGAVMYIENGVSYRISATTDSAYSSTETSFVHVGETVYIKSRSDSDHKGTGVITTVQGTNYTVDVKEGAFIMGESVYIYRADTYKSTVRIGGGSVLRNDPIAVTGNGSIVAFAVKDGDAVERGDILFETLEGTFDGLYMSGSSIVSPADGVIGRINMEQGSPVQKNETVAVIYPIDAMRIEAEVSEDDLGMIAVGDPVEIELSWNQDEDITYAGTITMISAIATENMSGENDGVTYTVYIDFEADQDTRYGMSAYVTTLDDEQEAEEKTDEIEMDEEEQETEYSRPLRPQGK